ncbi:SPFH domain-containing protein [Niabella hibiscisoli]|uniref:SPFH domain-containing protein n=1 Tax=Niabella hibiscisoli TaxID=1825928 RepID=UPI001F0D3391|nr:SPFH domain-containing protein [Niabella hibiscisoli]MCH5718478.1 SPFH domain-containing protein [Niabella hibiscisoli]
MGIKNFLRRQLSQVIEWNSQQPDVLVYQFPSTDDEIKNASKLLVGPGQGAVLVYEGKVTDHIDQQGIYNLETDNHPFVTTLLKLRTAFESEHKLKIWFYRTAEIVNQNWGTATPVKYMDPVYKIPVELGANGSFAFRIQNALHLFNNVVGSQSQYLVQDARQLLQNRFPQAMAAVLAQSGWSYQHIDAQLPVLSESIRQQLLGELQALGFELTDFKVNGTVFDDATKERIDKVANITAEAMAAAEGGLTYVEMEKLKALRDAARNEGGLAGAGLQLGVGMELGKAFDSAKTQQLDAPAEDVVTKLQQLKLLLTEGIITQEEFDTKKKNGWQNFN